MIEQGIVIASNNERVTVQMEKSDKCHNCTLCDSSGADFRTLEAVNLSQARIGDRVEVEIKAANILLYSFLLFIFPILLMIAGYYAGSSLAGAEGARQEAGIIGAMLGIAAAFILIKIFTIKIKGDKVVAYVNRIITTE